jgi:hypothetical protein
MECTIRPALEDDAARISAVIVRALRETNAKDYPNEIIERIVRGFSPDAVRQLIGQRTVFVATIRSRIVGTASLDGPSSALSSSLHTFRPAASASC